MITSMEKQIYGVSKEKKKFLSKKKEKNKQKKIKSNKTGNSVEPCVESRLERIGRRFASSSVGARESFVRDRFSKPKGSSMFVRFRLNDFFMLSSSSFF